MGFMRWLRGGDGETTATSMVSAGLAEIDGLFRPSKHKQTEHVEEQKRRRVDVSNSGGIDLDRGVAVIRTPARPPAPAAAKPAQATVQSPPASAPPATDQADPQR
jgi:hypothetical protein